MALIFKDLNGEIIRLPIQLSDISIDYLENIVTGTIEGYEVTILGNVSNSYYKIDEGTYNVLKEYLCKWQMNNIKKY